MAGSNRSRSGSSRGGGGQAVASNRSARIQELTRSLNSKISSIALAKQPKTKKAARATEQKLRQYNAVLEQNRIKAGYGGPQGGKGGRAAARALEVKSGGRRIRYGAAMNSLRSGGYRLGGREISARRVRGVISR